ncbi:MAG: ribose 5-phosphate isomerase B [Bacillota bacterium]
MDLSVAVASDHAGFYLKEEICAYLRDQGIPFRDFGVYGAEPADYPDQAVLVAEAVAKDEYRYGILVCGTGVGMAITANKVPGIRAVVCSDTFSARMARAHNDCNVLCLGGRVVGPGLAVELVAAFLATEFLGERHARRVEKITALEEKYRRVAADPR